MKAIAAFLRNETGCSQRRRGRSWRTVLFSGLVLFGLACTAHASSLEEVKIRVLPDGYEISLNSLYSYQVKNISPTGKGSRFYVQLKTFNYASLLQEDKDDISGNVVPAWDRSTGLPLGELSFDGSDAENPKLNLVFTEDVDVSAHSSGDLKMLIIRITTARPPVSEVLESQKGTGISLPETAASAAQAPEAPLMAEAKEALAKAEYDRAVQLYTKILLTATGDLKQQAQELLGVARERNGQLAHAAAEYQKYLKDYPQGPEANRVRQRLAGVVTASQEPKTALKESLTSAQRAKAERALWSSQYFGSVSQFYNWDTTKVKGGKFSDSVRNLTNDVDLNGRWKSKGMEVRTRFTGGTMQNYNKGAKDEDRLSAFYTQVSSKEQGFYTRVGRQSLSTGGVLGRFDGVHVSQQLNPVMKLNGVYGFPVGSVRNPEIDPSKSFTGMNIDWGAPKQKWNYNTYFINQINTGLTDRRAVGGEIRYFDQQKAFFTMVDYDTYFKQLDILSFNGHLTLPTKTTLTLSGDYRKTPLLTVNNSITGMGVNEISDLKDSFTRKELRQLALDRTTNSKSASFGISQDLMKDLQWTADMSVSATEGTVSSQGIAGLIEGSDAAHADYSYGTELIASNVFKEEDSLITGLGYTDNWTSNDNSFHISLRYPLTKKVRLYPKVMLSYQTQKESADHRVLTRPTMHVDFFFTKAVSFELEFGSEWVSQITQGSRTHTAEQFVTAGYRFIF